MKKINSLIALLCYLASLIHIISGDSVSGGIWMVAGLISSQNK